MARMRSLSSRLTPVNPKAISGGPPASHMNILVASEPGADGVFRYTEGLCQFLLQQGARVHLAYSDRRACARLPDLVRRIEQAGGRTLNLGVANRPCLADASALFRLRRFVLEIRPDVIHGMSSKAGALSRALRLLGVSGVFVYHPHAYVGFRPTRGRVDFLYDLVERLLGRFSHTVASSSDEAGYASQRLRLPARRVHLIENGVDLTRFQPATAERRRTLRRAFGLPENALILGTLGRTSAQKDPFTLYHAFAGARASRPDLYLFHLGRGEFDSALSTLAREPALAGHVIRQSYLDDTLPFYQAIDGFCLTSRYEGHSIAAIEALACGLPLILSDAPGNRGYAHLGLSHLHTAQPGDIDAFTQAILRWADSPRDNCNHRAVALNRYDSRVAYARVHRLYTQIAPARQPKTEALPFPALPLP